MTLEAFSGPDGKKKENQGEAKPRRNGNGNGEAIGDLVFKDGLLSGPELIFDYRLDVLKGENYSEGDVDSKSVSILKELGWKEQDEIRQHKTNIAEIDDYLKSKKVESHAKGHADVYLLVNDKLRVVIDNKSFKESAEKGIGDAIYYADCLIAKQYDIRIVASFDGKKCLLRVYDSKSKSWVPFLVNGVQLSAFPSKELVETIYRHRDISGIRITESSDTVNISNIVQGLKETYRNVPHIQNDNQKAMDFTIAFIALKSILEKHGNELGRNWDDLNIAQQKKLKEKVKDSVEDIIDNLQNGYEEIFSIQEDTKGKIRGFDFLEAIRQSPDVVGSGEKGYLVQIFETINRLPHLHASRFDPFAEVYQSLMDKSTRKIFGQFFTPRHLIKTLIRLFYEDEMEVLVGDQVKNGKPSNPKILCDPACGTGGFLTESFKFFAAHLTDIDVISLSKKTVYGFDIYPANAARSRINMYLAGDGFSRIEWMDSLKGFQGSEAMQFDYILTNPPFGKGDYVVDGNVISNRRKEVNFLIKVVKLLKPRGKALIIVPDGVLEAPTLAPLRNWLLRNCTVEKIVGLPKFEFAPYTHEKTYALFLRKRSIPINDLQEAKTERIWMYIIDNEGYANSDKKFRTGKKDADGKWLHDELSLWKDTKGALHQSVLEENWKKKLQPKGEKYHDEWGVEIVGTKYGFVDLAAVLEKELVTYKRLNQNAVKKSLREKLGNERLELEDIFEIANDEEESVKQVKQKYQTTLDDMGIYYDPFEDEFVDERNPVREKTLNLLPEEYLRPRKPAAVGLADFAKGNDELLRSLKKELSGITEVLEEYGG